MSACSEVEVESLVFGDLGPEAAARVREHLGCCARCREEHGELLRERRLFAERRWPRATPAGPSELLPDFETIVARSAACPPPPPFFAGGSRLVEAALDSTGAVRSRMSQLLVAAGAGLWLVHLVRAEPAPVVESASMPTHAEVQADRVAAPGVGPDPSGVACTDEEPVCRESHGTAWKVDRAMSAVTPVERPLSNTKRPGGDCGSEQRSVPPGPLDRTRMDLDPMCVADAI